MKTLENKADIFTKDVTSDVYEAHIGDYIIQRQIIATTSEELENLCTFDSGGCPRCLVLILRVLSQSTVVTTMTTMTQ